MDRRERELGVSISTLNGYESAQRLSYPGLNIYRYEKNLVIPSGEKARIALNILNCVMKITGSNDPDIQLAMASYPLVDLLDDRINKDCAYDVLQDQSGAIAVILTNFGRENERRFCIGDKKAIQNYLVYNMHEYIRQRKQGINGKLNYAFVVNGGQFTEKEIGNMKLPGQLRIKPAKIRKSTVAEQVIRMVHPPHVDYALLHPLELPKEISWPPIPLEYKEEHFMEIEQLLLNYIHHSFDREWLKEGKHMGVFTKSGKLIAMVGYQGCVVMQNGIKIILATDTVVAKEYERYGITGHLRLWSFSSEIEQAKREGIEPLFVADFVTPEAAAYGKHLGYKIAAPQNTIDQPYNYEFANWWWVGLEYQESES